MKARRCLAAMVVLVLLLLAAPAALAQEGAPQFDNPSTQAAPGSNAPVKVTPTLATTDRTASAAILSPSSVVGITDPALLSPSTMYDFSADAEFSVPTAFPGGAFSGSAAVRVVGSSWATWNPNTPGIHVLFCDGGQCGITFTDLQVGVGVVAEPNNFAVYNITVEAFDSADASLGAFTLGIHGDAGAAFLGLLSDTANIKRVVLTSEAAAGGFSYTNLTYKGFVPQPALTLTKTASPVIYSYPGQVVNYNYTIKNAGNVELAGPFTISDSFLGNFECAPAAALAVDATVSCTKGYTIIPADLKATNDGSITNKATAAGAYGGDPVTSAEVQVTVNQVAPSAGIFASTATCAQFQAGTAAAVNDVKYTVLAGKVAGALPATFTYYSRVVAPAADFQLVVQQANPAGWLPIAPLPNQGKLYNGDCVGLTPTPGFSSTGAVIYEITGATPGATYVVAVKYRPDALRYQQPVAAPYPTVPYLFTTAVDSAVVIPSWDSVNLKP